MITVNGLKNCDTCKKALKWLEHQGIEHCFHDVRAAGIDHDRLLRWCGEVGWDALLNRRGTTWRKLPEGDKIGIDEEKAIELMLEFPALIKRPVFESDGKIIVGFQHEQKDALLARD